MKYTKLNKQKRLKKHGQFVSRMFTSNWTLSELSHVSIALPIKIPKKKNFKKREKSHKYTKAGISFLLFLYLSVVGSLFYVPYELFQNPFLFFFCFYFLILFWIVSLSPSRYTNRVHHTSVNASCRHTFMWRLLAFKCCFYFTFKKD